MTILRNLQRAAPHLRLFVALPFRNLRDLLFERRRRRCRIEIVDLHKGEGDEINAQFQIVATLIPVDIRGKGGLLRRNQDLVEYRTEPADALHADLGSGRAEGTSQTSITPEGSRGPIKGKLADEALGVARHARAEAGQQCRADRPNVIESQPMGIAVVDKAVADLRRKPAVGT